jgi:hypothetical protein
VHAMAARYRVVPQRPTHRWTITIMTMGMIFSGFLTLAGREAGPRHVDGPSVGLEASHSQAWSAPRAEVLPVPFGTNR